MLIVFSPVVGLFDHEVRFAHKIVLSGVILASTKKKKENKRKRPKRKKPNENLKGRLRIEPGTQHQFYNETNFTLRHSQIISTHLTSSCFDVTPWDRPLQQEIPRPPCVAPEMRGEHVAPLSVWNPACVNAIVIFLCSFHQSDFALLQLNSFFNSLFVSIASLWRIVNINNKESSHASALHLSEWISIQCSRKFWSFLKIQRFDRVRTDACVVRQWLIIIRNNQTFGLFFCHCTFHCTYTSQQGHGAIQISLKPQKPKLELKGFIFDWDPYGISRGGVPTNRGGTNSSGICRDLSIHSLCAHNIKVSKLHTDHVVLTFEALGCTGCLPQALGTLVPQN